MAIKKGKFIIGKIGSTVFKVRKGIQIIQEAPGRGGVKQTAATKKAASHFGKSSALAKVFRHCLAKIILGKYDGLMVSRMTGAVSEIIRQFYDAETETYNLDTNSFDSLIGFNFNIDSPLKKSLWLAPQSELSNGILTVTIPESQIPLELKFINQTNTCTLKIAFGLINLKEGMEYKFSEIQKIEIKSDQGMLEEQKFKFQVPKGCLVIAGILLDYYKVTGSLGIKANSKAFHPSGICAIHLNPGIFAPEDPAKWIYNFKAKLQ